MNHLLALVLPKSLSMRNMNETRPSVLHMIAGMESVAFSSRRISKVGKRDMELTHGLGNEDHFHCIHSLSVTEEEEMPSPAMREG
jgi:hypothetical protein